MNLLLAMVTAGLLGAALAFGQPVRSSLVPSVVPRALLLRAIVTMTIGMNVAMIIGPAVGGLIIRNVGIEWAFTVEAVLFVVGFVTLVPLRLPANAGSTAGQPFDRRQLLESIRGGLAFVWHHPTLRALFAMLTVGGFLMMGASNLLLPEIAKDRFGRGADEASRLFAFMGVGMMLTSIFLLAKGGVSRKGKVFLLAMVGGTGVQVLQGLAPSYWVLAVLLLCWGGTGGWYLNLNQTLIQSATPPEMMGRVMSLHTLCQVGLSPLGSLAAGLLATGAGASATMSIFGAVGIGPGAADARPGRASCAPSTDRPTRRQLADLAVHLLVVVGDLALARVEDVLGVGPALLGALELVVDGDVLADDALEARPVLHGALVVLGVHGVGVVARVDDLPAVELRAVDRRRGSGGTPGCARGCS